MKNQFDLFDAPSQINEAAGHHSKTNHLSHEDMAIALAATGQYRILRKLKPRPIITGTSAAFPKIGVIIDTETTGLNHRTDEIIEIGAVAFTFAEDGTIGNVIGVYGGLQQPTVSIPAAITRLTGITDDMVKGHSFDMSALRSLIEPADLIVAHNANFDRPFCENLSNMFAPKAWACSVSEVDWSERGYEGTKLGYLVGQAGFFHDGHRAVDDCFALLEVLDKSHAHGSAFAELYRASQKSRMRIWAPGTPFEMKDILKARGYRWSDGSDGQPKSWWTEIDPDMHDEEIAFLRTEIYAWNEADPPTRRLTAHERFKA